MVAMRLWYAVSSVWLGLQINLETWASWYKQDRQIFILQNVASYLKSKVQISLLKATMEKCSEREQHVDCSENNMNMEVVDPCRLL